jgi:hypothetical protein
MTKIVLLVLGLLLVPSVLHAQTGQPLQSLKRTQSACSFGSQSLRVCNGDLRSCTSICNATALDPRALTAGCTTRCCNQFNVCLRLRGCKSRVIECK